LVRPATAMTKSLMARDYGGICGCGPGRIPPLSAGEGVLAKSHGLNAHDNDGNGRGLLMRLRSDLQWC